MWRFNLFRALPTLKTVTEKILPKELFVGGVTEKNTPSLTVAFLKIKIKSLADEAKTIRHEEGKHKKWRWVPTKIVHHMGYATETVKGHWETRWLPLQNEAFNTNQATMSVNDVAREIRLFQSLYRHRTVDVRQEARHALLAYGFIRGRSYAQLESNLHANTLRCLEWSRVARIVRKFAPEKLSGTSKEDDTRELSAWWRESRGP
jgi:hypothetical protein